MEFYLIISHFSYSFLFLPPPPSPIHHTSNTATFGHASLLGVGYIQNSLYKWEIWEWRFFFFYPSHPRAKCLCRFLTPVSIFVILVMVVMVLGVVIFALTTLDTLTLDLFPHQIYIYPRAPRSMALTLTSTPSPASTSTTTTDWFIHEFYPSSGFLMALHSLPGCLECMATGTSEMGCRITIRVMVRLS